MRISSKGQITIPVAIRRQAGLLSGNDVDVVFDGRAVHIVQAKAPRKAGHGKRLVAHLRGRGDVALSTDAIMALMRGP